MDPEDPMNIVQSEIDALADTPLLQRAAVPSDLEYMSVPDLITFTRSLADLNHVLVDNLNALVKTSESFAASVGSIVAMQVELVERLEADEQAAAEQASETAAAAGWPESLSGQSTTAGEAIREGLAAQCGKR